MIRDVLDFHVEMVEEGWLGISLLCILLLFYMFIGILAFQILDSGLGESKMLHGRVTGKDHIPAHTVVTSTGKTIITTWIPDSYTVDAYFFEIDSTLSCAINESAYSLTDLTSDITASVSSGYFTDSYYCE